jgi:formylglycine-generating enzyme required for sulfatase activity
VINVSWGDARSYVEWLNCKTGKAYRLPSESEWEYVARAGTTTPFHLGAPISSSQVNFNGDYTYNGSSEGANRRRTIPVGSFAVDNFDLYDVHGNVWEWVEDCWNESYSGAPDHGEAHPTGICLRRVLRGGSWGEDPGRFRVTRTGDRFLT